MTPLHDDGRVPEKSFPRNYCSNVTNTQFRGTRKAQPSIPSTLLIHPFLDSVFCERNLVRICLTLTELLATVFILDTRSQLIFFITESRIIADNLLVFQFHLTKLIIDHSLFIFSHSGSSYSTKRGVLSSSPLSHLFVDISNRGISARRMFAPGRRER